MSTAIIGLGAMGLGMAGTLLREGIALKGFDVFAPSLAKFEALGGTACDTAEAAAEEATLLILMVVNAAQAQAVLFEQGAAAALAPGATVMLCSTVAPSEARAIAARLAESQIATLDAPVSGGQVGAETGALTIMASGPARAFERAEAELAAMAGKVHRLGDEAGMGATYKVVHQLAAGVHLAAAAELLSLGAKAGCDPQVLLEIVTGAAGGSWMLGNRGPRMLMEDPPVTSSVDIFVKDLGLVLQAGREAEAVTPLAAIAHQMFLGARSMGHGKDDDALVIRAYEALSGAAAWEKTR